MNISQERTTRFKDANWFPVRGNVIVGGAGGIGSWLILLLARLGVPNLMAYDDDQISATNLGGQLFSDSSVGQNKIYHLYDTVRSYASNIMFHGMEQKYIDTSETTEWMFMGFDNMAARTTMFNNWKKHLLSLSPESRKECILIDGRLEAEQFQIFCVTEDTMDAYESEHLFGDHEIPDAPCTLKQTSHMAAMIAATMTGFFTNHLANLRLGEQIRAVPFFHEYAVAPNLTTTLDEPVSKILTDDTERTTSITT